MRIQADNAILYLFPNFIKAGQASLLFQHLEKAIAWRQDHIMMYGNALPLPRLQAWYGDQRQKYTYSGIHLTSQNWLPVLDKMKTSLNQQCSEILNQPVEFNAMLANLYRNQQDSVAWHSDDEPELGQQPVIASVSLGASREFKMKHQVSGEKLTIPLTSGSLLIMAGDTQQYWQHAILKSKKSMAPRINLTFRHIIS